MKAPSHGDRFQPLVERLLACVLGAAGTLAPAIREAVLARAARAGGARRAGVDVPEELQPLVDKIARHAYTTTDDDYGKLREAGYTEDQLFELTVAASVGAAWARLDRGLAALRGRR